MFMIKLFDSLQTSHAKVTQTQSFEKNYLITRCFAYVCKGFLLCVTNIVNTDIFH